MGYQVCASLHLQTDQWRKIFITLTVTLNSYDLFLTVLVYMQQQNNCSHKTWHIHIEIAFNGMKKVLSQCLTNTNYLKYKFRDSALHHKLSSIKRSYIGIILGWW